MTIAIITGAAGLIGSEAARFFARQGFVVVGIDNDLRATFFGSEASTAWSRRSLEESLGSQYVHRALDVRDRAAVERLFEEYGSDVKLVIHAAAQPSHDWAARDPHTDFTVNANGTLVTLEATRRFASDAVFIFCSTNKVYGDAPNLLPLVEESTRWEIEPGHPYEQGIDETMSIDASTHSLFGASKVAADVLVQEYGRYFGMKTACFRGGCLTGPGHSGAQLHGFLAYLMKCTMRGDLYTVFGYEAKQVRDNIHSYDLVNAFHHFYRKPRCGEVYNIGGSRFSNCSMREAIKLCEAIAEKTLQWSYNDQARAGDHMWYISDVRKFQSHYPEWRYEYDLRATVADIYQGLSARAGQ
jgi:CDP-paratose 2-epimerase